MPYTVPTSNSGSTYFNTNQCFSYNSRIGTAAVNLTNAICLSTQPCSEVIIWNDTAVDIYIFAGPNDAPGDFAKYSDQARALLLHAKGTSNQGPITVRGLTNCNQVSAFKAGAGANDDILYYRTQFFSNNPSR